MLIECVTQAMTTVITDIILIHKENQALRFIIVGGLGFA